MSEIEIVDHGGYYTTNSKLKNKNKIVAVPCLDRDVIAKLLDQNFRSIVVKGVYDKELMSTLSCHQATKVGFNAAPSKEGRAFAEYVLLSDGNLNYERWIGKKLNAFVGGLL